MALYTLWARRKHSGTDRSCGSFPASASPIRKTCGGASPSSGCALPRPLFPAISTNSSWSKPPRATNPAPPAAEEAATVPPLTRALREFLLDIRPAENLLVLKTPPSGAQPLAAAVDGSKFPEIAGTIAGDDTVLIITPNRKTRESLQKKIEAQVK